MGQSLEDQIFENHYNYYKNVGIETIKQQAGQVEQVSSDYQGRVIYELLQNAFDKANKNILVMVRGNTLYVANDGEKFTYVANYDYDKGTSKRGDFQSMCSISTSTKIADTSIGNKGVGFKSVFSISESGYVNVYTKGLILEHDKSIIEETISFRIFDSYKSSNEIQVGFEPELLNTIKYKIDLVQQERKERGIPGYYFPFHITNEKPEICELFDKGFVTIIEIPFKDKSLIKDLFDEIEQIHFQFIQLKKEKDFVIEFNYDEDIHIKKVSKDSALLFSAVVESDEIKLLAKEAEIKIEYPKVAFFIRDDEKGQIYNYLPTKVKSPFKYVDFHADFHTTVDRKSINFDGKIGKYNKALLKACLELYFSVFNTYTDNKEDVKLNVSFIDINKINRNFDSFDWRLIEIDNSLDVFREVTSILSIWDWNYQLASSFFAKIAKKFFSQSRDAKMHDVFFKNISYFIEHYSSTSLKREIWTERFKLNFSETLKQESAQIIPNTIWSKNTELVYQDKNDGTIKLPSFLGINITNFEIKDEFFRKALGIKEFKVYDELLKYYKQCSYTGEYKYDAISEEQQKELLASLYQLFELKKAKPFFITHRFNLAFNSTLRDKYSTENQANFNISTIFLKTLNKKYKPAQLCTFNELDLDFLLEVIPKSKETEFLQFLGVSTNSKYLFADKRIFNSLNDGISYIPSLSDRKEEKIDEKLIENVCIITPNGKQVHPAIVNDNNYRFLENINNLSIKDELDNLKVKKYNEFPTPYRKILQEQITNNLLNNNDIIRLYQSVFLLFEKSKQYLIIENGKLSWTSTTDFLILKTKSDFDLLIPFSSTKILCYYSGSNIPEYLEKNIITPQKGKIISANQTSDDELKKKIEERFIYLLISISNSKNSDKNYLDDNTDLTTLQARLKSLEIIEVNNLEQEILFDKKLIISSRAYAIDSSMDGKLYFNKGANSIQKAEGIAEFIFGNTSIKELVELIVFYKTDIKELQNSFDVTDFEIISKKWKPDYYEKWSEFQKIILKDIVNDFNQLPSNWYYYNKHTQSNILVQIERKYGFLKFNEIIEFAKPNFEGYFDNFKLEIDENIYFDKIAKIETFLTSKNNDDANLLLNQLRSNKFKLGIENFIKDIESQIELKFEDYRLFDKPELVEKNKKEIIINNKIEDIYQQIIVQKTKEITNTSFADDSFCQETIKHNSSKKIFKTDIDGKTSEINYEAIGSTGEIEVLNYYIEHFLQYSISDRLKGVDEVYKIIEDKLGDNSMLAYKNNCISVIGNDVELKKALIPFFYITMHYKFSSFDLIAFKDNKPILVEVKTTNSNGNNRFFISIAEVNIATGDIDYEIVRVTPSSINFIGNPIKIVEEKISAIKADTFSLTPRNYEFISNK